MIVNRPDIPFRQGSTGLDTLQTSPYDPGAVDLPELKDDPHLKVVRPLVEAYLAFSRADNRHIRSMRLTPSQFDVLVTLGDTNGLTCSELSAATLVTKGTLTGVLDRLCAKGLIRRDPDKRDRRSTTIRLTPKGDALFRSVFGRHIAFLRPYFEHALSADEVEVVVGLLRRVRDSFSSTHRRRDTRRGGAWRRSLNS